jgi:signal transduction histidine kinase
MGYTEVLFAIVINGRFLGAVFVGQILRVGDFDRVDIFDEFIESSHAKVIKIGETEAEHLSAIDTLRRMRLHERGLADREKRFGFKILMESLAENIKAVDADGFSRLINESAESVRKLHDELEEIVYEKIRQKIENELSETYHDAAEQILRFETKSENKSMNFDRMTKHFEKVFRDIFVEKLEQFGISNIYVLGMGKRGLVDGSETKMELVMSASRGIDEPNWEIECSEILEELPKYPWDPTNSFAIERENYEFGQRILRLLHSKDNESCNAKLSKAKETHMFVLYKEWLVLFEAAITKHTAKIYDMLLTTLSKYLTPFLSIYEITFFKLIGDLYFRTLLLYRHECVKIAGAIIEKNERDYRALATKIARIRSRYFKYNKLSKSYALTYRRFDEVGFYDASVSFFSNKRNLLLPCDDIRANTQLIVHMADTIGIITRRLSLKSLSSSDYKREDFDFTTDILNKWVTTHRISCELREKHLKITTISHVSRPEIYHWKRLLDIVVYNLLDNALKYSHWGTEIRITVGDGIGNYAHYLPIKIENYGSKIEKAPKAFEIFHRDNQDSTHIEGDGLGLYVVKEISDLLKLDIDYWCEEVSKLNVGLMERYKTSGSNPEIKQAISEEEKRIEWKILESKNNDAPNSISSIEVSKKELERHISRPTYHVCFQMTIQKEARVDNHD